MSFGKYIAWLDGDSVAVGSLAAVSSVRRLGLGPGWSFLLERLTFALGSDVLRRHILTLRVTFLQVFVARFLQINNLRFGTADA
jgi:hypothetical protein